MPMGTRPSPSRRSRRRRSSPPRRVSRRTTLPPGDRDWVETHGVPEDELVELACRSMKCVAARSDEWHERLTDLRYRLGDIAAA